jgi:MerR family copper efflux transcriptional regulator
MTPMTNNLRLPVFSQLGGSPPTPGSSPTLDAGLDPAEGSGEGPIEAEHGLMQIGDLARECGKTVRAIHLYEELDLLKPAARSKGRYRLYGSDALVRIRWIGKLQEMGFSLSDIQTVVKDWEQLQSAPRAMVRMREVYKKKLEETKAQVKRLQSLAHEMEASLRYLDTCEVCDPERLLSACTKCDMHDCSDKAPDLVAGFRAQRVSSL